MGVFLILLLGFCVGLLCGLLFSSSTALEYQVRIRKLMELEEMIRTARQEKSPRQERIREAERYLRCVKLELKEDKPNIEFVDRSLRLGIACLTSYDHCVCN